jgi:glycosyltransferase involved in cell wall biosynthesis
MTIINQKNQGQSFSRNLGLTLAKSEYVSFIDGDDKIEVNFLDELVSKIKSNDLDIINCSYLNFYENSKFNFISKLNGKFENKIYTGKAFFNLRPSVSPCDKIYKKKFLIDNGFKFLEGHFAEDVLAISQLFFYANKVMYLDKPLYKYRRNSTNSTRNSSKFSIRLKLSSDKLIVSNHIHFFSKRFNWKGYNQYLIVRNIIGVFFTIKIFNSIYFKSVKNDIKRLKMFSIFLYNFKFFHLLDFFKVLTKKIFNRL